MSFKPQRRVEPAGQGVLVPREPDLDNYTNILGLQEEGIERLRDGALALGDRPAQEPHHRRDGRHDARAGRSASSPPTASPGSEPAGRQLPFQILQLRMFPPIAIIIPLLFMFVELELWNTYLGLIILYGAVTFPFVVWLMRSFFQEVPREISEAAIVDGCTQWGAFFKAVLPLVKGGLAATALFVFILNWSRLPDRARS